MRKLVLVSGFLVLALAGCASVPPAARLDATAPGAGPPSFTMSKVFRSSNVRKGCPPEGNAKPDSVKALNILKNRDQPPGANEVDPAVNLAALLQPGDDEERWDEAKAGEVVGYVHDIKVGGVETTNCKATDPADRDTHIELALGPAQSGPTQLVIVEVTPRWRDKMSAQNTNWSTQALKDQLVGHWIRVKGWLLFDHEHVNQAENTNPGNDRNWRATVWELHPITGIDILAGKPN